ncbi:hypothetical protein M422DRAFT_777829 [Sphaerobolus stellatus SS14]|nr:hypothetical protein M422DRAFT_777829 [Sphaerobolus stellatus SS14]
MMSLGLFAIVTFTLSFTTAAPLKGREPNTNALVQRDTDTADAFGPIVWAEKREVDTADAFGPIVWAEKREVDTADAFGPIVWAEKREPYDRSSEWVAK